MQKPLYFLFSSFIGTSWFTALACVASSDNLVGSGTITESRKYKLFIGTAIAAPTRFKWQHHDVSIREAWFEHPLIRQSDKKHWNEKWNCLCFTLNLDGKPEFGKPTDRRALTFTVEAPESPESYNYMRVVVPVKFKHFPPGSVRHLVYFRADSAASKIKLHENNDLPGQANSPMSEISFSINNPL